MREAFEKYYTVRLFCQPDLHFVPDIKDIPGEFDTEEEARAAAESEWHKYDKINYAGVTYNWWEIQVIEHYKKVLRNPDDYLIHKIALVKNDGSKSIAYLDESRQIIFCSYVTVDFARLFGYKVVKETKVEE